MTPRAHSEAGFTLIELIVVMSIVALFLLSLGLLASNSHGELYAARLKLQSTFVLAGSYARLYSGPDNTGLTMAFTTDPQTKETVVQLYRNRPILNAIVRDLVPIHDQPPMRTRVKILLQDIDGAYKEPPFAIFIGSSWHTVAEMGYIVGGRRPAKEPLCPARGVIQLKLIDGDAVALPYVNCFNGVMAVRTASP